MARRWRSRLFPAGTCADAWLAGQRRFPYGPWFDSISELSPRAEWLIQYDEVDAALYRRGGQPAVSIGLGELSFTGLIMNDCRNPCSEIMLERHIPRPASLEGCGDGT